MRNDESAGAAVFFGFMLGCLFVIILHLIFC